MIILVRCLCLRHNESQGPVSRKPQTLFWPAKPVLIVRVLKTKKCIGMKLCIKGNFVQIYEKNSSVNLRGEKLNYKMVAMDDF